MNCGAAQEWILAAIEIAPNGAGDAPAEPRMTAADRASFEEHVAGCEACTRFREFQRFADQALAAEFANIEPDAGLTDWIRAATGQHKGATPRWLADALNAIGAMFTVGVFSTLDLSLPISMTVVLGVLTLTAIAGYPLLLLRRG